MAIFLNSSYIIYTSKICTIHVSSCTLHCNMCSVNMYYVVVCVCVCVCVCLLTQVAFQLDNDSSYILLILLILRFPHSRNPEPIWKKQSYELKRL